MGHPDYSIWVLEYGRVPDFPVGAIVYGAHNAGTRNMPFAYVLIRGQGRTIMVDTGMSDNETKRHMQASYGLVDWQSPRTVLGNVGVDPFEVDSVYVTHAHWDHIGNLEAFPNATVYLQHRELDQWIWAWSQPERMRWFNPPVDPVDLDLAKRLSVEGRLRLVDGDLLDVAPGIDLRAALDTHTFGSMWVAVRNGPDGERTFALAGDNVYAYENLDGWDGSGRLQPVGHVVGSHQNWLRTVDDMIRTCGGDMRRIIPVHEDRIGSVYPTTTSNEGLMIVEVAGASLPTADESQP